MQFVTRIGVVIDTFLRGGQNRVHITYDMFGANCIIGNIILIKVLNSLCSFSHIRQRNR